MPVGPRIYPAGVDTDDGTLNIARALVIVDYTGDPLTCTRIRVYGPDTTCVLNEPVTRLVEGQAPGMVYGRHQFTLADGRTAYVMAEGGCGCGSRLKSFQPDGPFSGRRP